MLLEHGVDTDGIIVYGAADISADGTKFVGVGLTASGKPELWQLDLSVPEPSTMLMARWLVGCYIARREPSARR